MKSFGSFYHLQENIKTWQSQATRTSKLIWGREMALEEPFVHSEDGDVIQEKKKKNAKEAFALKRKARSWNNEEMNSMGWKCTSDAQARPRHLCSLRHAIILQSGSPANYYSAHICSAFIYWRKEKAVFWEGEVHFWNITHTAKSIYHNVMESWENSHRENTPMFSAPSLRNK